ncbi:hypothetical protein Nepgr_025883 [Nepenthes gracilis]|uniref:Uncharacterized protein n=1 Tax=Nepenthes gracilis TaxID=150966 RepID=A0AAD3T6W5_NEPGR|nr:hypothetical protein Nepgr_025883 [Nepenthes gracilis]
MRTTTYQHQIARYYNKKVKARQFDVGDLFLRSIEATERWPAGTSSPRIGAYNSSSYETGHTSSKTRTESSKRPRLPLNREGLYPLVTKP